MSSAKEIMERYSKKFMDEFEEGFSFPKKYIDLYEGSAYRQFPSLISDQYTYYFNTSALNGIFNSFNFGDDYQKKFRKYKKGQDKNGFEQNVDEHYKNFQSVNYYLHIDIPENTKINVKATFDTLEVTSEVGNSISNVELNDGVDYLHYANSGPKVVNKTFGSDVVVNYYQRISDDVISNWSNKRMLGFEVTWKVSLDGQEVPSPKYSSEIPNVVFRKLVNILQEGTKPEKVWEAAKKIRIDWLNDNNYKNDILASFCVASILNENLQELLMNKLIENLSLEGSDLNKIQTNVEDTNLKLASKIQNYLTNCPSKDWIEKVNFLITLISTASPRMLIATTNGMIRKAMELEKEIEAEAFTEFLDKLTDVFNLNHRQIEFFIKMGAKKSWLGSYIDFQSR